MNLQLPCQALTTEHLAKAAHIHAFPCSTASRDRSAVPQASCQGLTTRRRTKTGGLARASIRMKMSGRMPTSSIASACSALRGYPSSSHPCASASARASRACRPGMTSPHLRERAPLRMLPFMYRRNLPGSLVCMICLCGTRRGQALLACAHSALQRAPGSHADWSRWRL